MNRRLYTASPSPIDVIVAQLNAASPLVFEATSERDSIRLRGDHEDSCGRQLVPFTVYYDDRSWVIERTWAGKRKDGSHHAPKPSRVSEVDGQPVVDARALVAAVKAHLADIEAESRAADEAQLATHTHIDRIRELLFRRGITLWERGGQAMRGQTSVRLSITATGMCLDTPIRADVAVGREADVVEAALALYDALSPP